MFKQSYKVKQEALTMFPKQRLIPERYRRKKKLDALMRKLPGEPSKIEIKSVVTFLIEIKSVVTFFPSRSVGKTNLSHQANSFKRTLRRNCSVGLRTSFSLSDEIMSIHFSVSLVRTQTNFKAERRNSKIQSKIRTENTQKVKKSFESLSEACLKLKTKVKSGKEAEKLETK